jgi:hypothetical protein
LRIVAILGWRRFEDSDYHGGGKAEILPYKLVNMLIAHIHSKSVLSYKVRCNIGRFMGQNCELNFRPSHKIRNICISSVKLN